MGRWLRTTWLGALLFLALAGSAAHAELLSKRYVFKKGVTLSMGADVDGGLRLDTVRFELPSPVGEDIRRVGGLVKAEVAVSNTSEEPWRFGIAIALFDDEDRLLGVASGGTGLRSLAPGRQRVYTLVFEKVSMEAARSTTFYVSVEPKP